MCLKRSQLKCQGNSKVQNTTLDFGSLKNILKEVVGFIIDHKQWIERFLLEEIAGNYMNKSLGNKKHNSSLLRTNK